MPGEDIISIWSFIYNIFIWREETCGKIISVLRGVVRISRRWSDRLSSVHYDSSLADRLSPLGSLGKGRQKNQLMEIFPVNASFGSVMLDEAGHHVYRSSLILEFLLPQVRAENNKVKKTCRHAALQSVTRKWDRFGYGVRDGPGKWNGGRRWVILDGKSVGV